MCTDLLLAFAGAEARVSPPVSMDDMHVDTPINDSESILSC